MGSDLVNLRKIEKMACLALKNGLRLHKESILLFKNKSFPSSYFLSILALEEVGKFFILEDFWWHSKVDGRMGKDWEKKFIGIIYFHRSKQNSFAYNLDGPMAKTSFSKDLYSGVIEKKKQCSVYVGLPRKNGEINLKGKIVNPFNITENKAQRQITSLNERITEFALGVVKKVYVVETECAVKILDKKLFVDLKKMWPMASSKVQKRISKLENI